MNYESDRGMFALYIISVLSGASEQSIKVAPKIVFVSEILSVLKPDQWSFRHIRGRCLSIRPWRALAQKE